MDSAALHHPSRQPTEAVSLETEFYFDALRCEHERLLAAVRRAGSHLGAAPGTLAEYSAVHARLLQRFLDAQRGLLRRRAEADRIANVIRTESEEAARSTLAAAHAEAVARMMRRALVAAHGGSDTHPLLEEWDRLDAADEEFGPMSGYLDVAGFNQIIDEELPRPAGEVDEMFAQLGRVLEQWWDAEQRHADAQAGHAVDRAALLDRLVAIEASEIVEAAGPACLSTEAEPAPAEPALAGATLPADLLAALDQADAGALDNFLADCVALLGGTIDSQAEPTEVSVEPVIEETVPPTGAALGSVQPLLRFAEMTPEARTESLTPAATISTGLALASGTAPVPTPATVVVARPAAPAADRSGAPDSDEETGESVGKQVGVIALRVVAPMAAFSLVFALLAWLVG